MPKGRLLTRTMLELADTLVANFDVFDTLTMLADRSVEALGVDAAGLMLVAPEGDLRVMASSSRTMRALELFELQAEQGPCLDCYRSGAPVAYDDLTRPDAPWPQFAAEAVANGFRSVQALPMRLRGTIIGALNLFNERPGNMQPDDVQAAQALADMATIAILQHRASHEAQVLNEQLNHALQSRIVIEQAKGMIAERERLDVEAAFAVLRTHARSHNLRLADVAQEVIDGTLPTSIFDQYRSSE